MKRVWITRRGGPGVLALREEPDPLPRPGEVRLRVDAAGVNFADVMIRIGLYPGAPRLPMVPGYEVAGVVDALGEGAPADLAGRRVLAFCNFGGYADVVCVPAGAVFPLPDSVTTAEAAALPVNFLTAWQMLEVMAPAGPGGTVLVHGAAGGVGTAATQLARRRGALVLGSASPSKHAWLRERGVQLCLDSRRRGFAAEVREATGGRGADVVLEPRHGRWIRESYESLAPTGRLVLFGFADAATLSGSRLAPLRTLAGVPWLLLNPLRLVNDNKGVLGVNLGRLWHDQARVAGWMQSILALAAAGEVRPVIDRAYLFRDADRAHLALQERRNRGKILLVSDAAAARGGLGCPVGDQEESVS
ncbi:MAG: zinc-binding dehydrogenase [Candidatus Latescibacteria bacterium]|nr:zinc-binding dehydrogenase [Candidatus Latescibacterota bacterium]